MKGPLLIAILTISCMVAGCSEQDTVFEEPGMILPDGSEIGLYLDKSDLEGLIDGGLYFGSGDYWEYEDFYIGYEDDLVTSIEAKTSRIQLKSGMKIGSDYAGDKDGSQIPTEFPGTVIYRHYYITKGGMIKPVTVKELTSIDKPGEGERYSLLDIYVDKGSGIILFIMLKDVTSLLDDYIP